MSDVSFFRRIEQNRRRAVRAFLRPKRRRKLERFSFKKPKKKQKGQTMQYERLVSWAVQAWEERYPTVAYMTIWASPDCSNRIAQSQVKVGRKIKGKYTYDGFDILDSHVITSISDYGARSGRMVLTATSGAYIFKFSSEQDSFSVVYASSYFDDDVQDLTAIALVPDGKLDIWAAFESICGRVVRPKIQRRRDVYIIGGTESFFDPNVEWGDVILDDTLKGDIFNDIEAFFSEGVEIYRKLKLTPFRKLVLAGMPGTGKTMLCAALAKHALGKRRVVVYVSGSDREGATFEKMQRAFQAVASARYPTLMIVEEIDAYLNGEDKARILNVLDGIESPNNPKGTLMLATTNYPDAIDDRVLKRPGRLDRIFVVPTIAEVQLAEKMLRHYMADQWKDEHREIVQKLLHQPGAFVREVALHARMIAAHERNVEVTLDNLEKSVDSLLKQMRVDGAVLVPRRPLGLEKRRRSGFVPDDDLDSAL